MRVPFAAWSPSSWLASVKGSFAVLVSGRLVSVRVPFAVLVPERLISV